MDSYSQEHEHHVLNSVNVLAEGSGHTNRDLQPVSGFKEQDGRHLPALKSDAKAGAAVKQVVPLVMPRVIQ